MPLRTPSIGQLSPGETAIQARHGSDADDAEALQDGKRDRPTSTGVPPFWRKDLDHARTLEACGRSSDPAEPAEHDRLGESSS
jgi:hypothetical protein